MEIQPDSHIHHVSFPVFAVLRKCFGAKIGLKMSSISKLVSTALATFESLERIAKAHGHAQAESLRSNLTRFKLWAGSVGAHRPYGHRSLEYRLSGTSIIRGHVVKLLEDVCEHLQEGGHKWIFRCIDAHLTRGSRYCSSERH